MEGEIVSLAVMVAAGVFLATTYWIFTMTICPKNSVGLLIAQFIFWIISARLIFKFIYYSSYGQLSFYGIIAFLIGAAGWYKVLGKRTVYAKEKKKKKQRA